MGLRVEVGVAALVFVAVRVGPPGVIVGVGVGVSVRVGVMVGVRVWVNVGVIVGELVVVDV